MTGTAAIKFNLFVSHAIICPIPAPLWAATIQELPSKKRLVASQCKTSEKRPKGKRKRIPHDGVYGSELQIIQEKKEKEGELFSAPLGPTLCPRPVHPISLSHEPKNVPMSGGALGPAPGAPSELFQIDA